MFNSAKVPAQGETSPGNIKAKPDSVRRPAENNQPEHDLLARVEARCFGMNPLGEQTTADREPFHIAPARNVMTHPKQEHHDDPKNEREGDIAVRQLAVIGDCTEGFRT